MTLYAFLNKPRPTMFHVLLCLGLILLGWILAKKIG